MVVHGAKVMKQMELSQSSQLFLGLKLLFCPVRANHHVQHNTFNSTITKSHKSGSHNEQIWVLCIGGAETSFSGCNHVTVTTRTIIIHSKYFPILIG